MYKNARRKKEERRKKEKKNEGRKNEIRENEGNDFKKLKSKYIYISRNYNKIRFKMNLMFNDFSKTSR